MQDMESHMGSWKLQCKLSPVIRSQTIMEGSGCDHLGVGREEDKTTSYGTQRVLSPHPQPGHTGHGEGHWVGTVRTLRGGGRSFQKESVAIV